MCAIAGFNWQNKTLIKEMADSVQHRGPDAEGFYINNQISLGHRRLSILDLSKKGQQPMRFKHLVIIFNGEIYNFKELKEELKQKGHRFISQTDTEVILHSFYQWGPSCVQKFNGMWAFCIYDKKKNLLFLSRDRFGIKPLYYSFDKEKFIFASEIKAIRKHKLFLTINKKALNFYFYQKYIGKDLTIFNNIYKLQPSENLTFDLTKKTITKNKYYNLEKEIKKSQKAPINQKIKLIKNLIINAVEKRLISDVPVGAFLSGGLDSSLISAIITKKNKNFKTFSIGFSEESFNELKFSKIVAKHLKTKHYYQYLKIDEKIIKQVIGSLDEPFGDSSLLPAFLLSKIAGKKVKVSLSGDAGDEIFAGYDTYKAYKIAKYIPNFLINLLKIFINLLPPSEKKVNLAFKAKRFVSRFNKVNINKRHFDWLATFIDKERKKLLPNNFIKSEKIIELRREDNLLSLQLNDIRNYLSEDILKKVDIASMLNSLEARVPFLDYRLVPLTLSLPENYKIRGLQTKYLLKKIAKKHLPQKIIHRKKAGFTVPVSKWLKKSKLIKNYLLENEYYKHGLLNKNYVLNLYNQHMDKKEDNSRQLWLVFVFNYWWDKNG